MLRTCSTTEQPSKQRGTTAGGAKLKVVMEVEFQPEKYSFSLIVEDKFVSRYILKYILKLVFSI